VNAPGAPEVMSHTTWTWGLRGALKLPWLIFVSIIITTTIIVAELLCKYAQS
jgi:hypothetical protein